MLCESETAEEKQFLLPRNRILLKQVSSNKQACKAIREVS